MHDDTDDTTLTSRLMDENQQLREENRQLRNDVEHLLITLSRVQVEALS